MIIGIDASRANKPKKTGVEWYSYHLIEEFKKIDKENQFFLYTNEPLRGELAICPRNFKEVVLNWPIPRSWTLGRLSWEMKFGKYIPDLLFVPAHTIPLLNPKKSVVTVHDIGFEHFPEVYSWADKLYHKFTIQFIKRYATKIITVSNFSKEDLEKTYKIDPGKIKVVYNGYDQATYKVLDRQECRDYLKEKYQIDGPFILFIGRLEMKKNIVRIVDSFIKFKKAHSDNQHKLVLVGKPGFGYEKAIELIEKNGFQDQVIFPGWVSDKDLVKFHNASSLFLFPSLFEGFGIPVLEAMACNEPVVCSNTTSLPEVAGQAALQVNPEETAEIVQALEKVLLNREVAEDLRRQGLERVKRFSWRKCAEETLNELLK